MIAQFLAREEFTLKILRFNDDQIGVIKNDNMVVDVSDSVSARKAKGPQRVMEEIIEGWRKYRKRFEKVLAEQERRAAGERATAQSAGAARQVSCRLQQLHRPARSAPPTIFPMNIFTSPPDLVGPDGEVELRDIPSCVVYQPEAEFAFVIGKTAKDVTEKKALDHVFGYVPIFDISTRGMVRRTQFVGKGQGSHGCCGPWIITKDEIPDPHNVNVKSWTNGEPRQNYNTGAMAHKIPNQIAWLTKLLTAQPRRRRRHRNLSRGPSAGQFRRHHRDRVRQHGPGQIQSRRQQPAQRRALAPRQKSADPASRRRHAYRLEEWSDGVLECWNNGFEPTLTTPTLHYSNPLLLIIPCPAATAATAAAKD